ncbi:MAG: methyl-accepting chemotaxis protein [Pseudomonadota bacterium]
MKDWSISRRITVMVSALVTGLVVVGVIAMAATWYLISLSAQYKQLSSLSLLATMVQEDVLEAQVAAESYRARAAENELLEFNSNLDEVAAEIEALREKQSNSITVIDVDSLVATKAEYRAAFQEAAREQGARDVAQTDINQAASTARDAVFGAMQIAREEGRPELGIVAGVALRDFLVGSAALDRYTQSGDRAEFERMATAVDTAKAELSKMMLFNSSEAIGAQVENATAAIEAFRANADVMSSAIAARETQWAKIDRAADVLTGKMDVAVDQVSTEQNRVQQVAENIGIIAIIVVGVSAAGVSVAGAAFGWMTGKTIRTRLEDVVGTMTRLANGENDVEIAGTEQRNELGAVASALVVFRDRALEAEALEAEKAEREAAQRKADEDRLRAEAEAEEQRQVKLAEERQRVIRDLNAKVGNVVSAAAVGDFTHRIDADFDAPELREMAQAINAFVENVDMGLSQTAHVLEQLSAGDLTHRMDGNFEGTFAELKDNVNGTIETLAELVRGIQDQGVQVQGKANEMTEQAHELARRAEQQAASLEETSAAMAEIAASTQSSAEGAANAVDVATTASNQVDEAGKVVDAAVEAMADIRDASSRIGDIVSVIDGIAFQTNLLALNASVEAARAGSAGKGFAVVATEVRALAQRSSEASQDIKSLIEESSEQVQKGVSLVEETGTTLERIMGGVHHMASTIRDVMNTAQEQARGVSEVTSAMSQLDVITQKNAALADQSRTDAQGVSAQAKSMRDLVSTFRTDRSDTARSPSSIAAE